MGCIALHCACNEYTATIEEICAYFSVYVYGLIDVSTSSALAPALFWYFLVQSRNFLRVIHKLCHLQNEMKKKIKFFQKKGDQRCTYSGC